MLVLTRKSQEQIQIGNNITISVLRIKGNSVRIGIEAPRDVRIVRAELPPKDIETTSDETTAQAKSPTAREQSRLPALAAFTRARKQKSNMSIGDIQNRHNDSSLRFESTHVSVQA